MPTKNAVLLYNSVYAVTFYTFTKAILLLVKETLMHASY